MMYTKRIFLHAENNVPAFEKRLSICLQTNGFSFSVIDKKNTLYTFGDIDCQFTESLSEVINGIKQIFTSLNVPLSGYSNAELIMPTSKNVWIPKHLFSEGSEKEYLATLCQIDLSESCYSYYSETLDAHSVFAVSNTLVSGLKIAIPSVKIKNQFVKMLDFPCLKNNKVGVSVGVFVRDNDIDIAISDSEKFIFNNTFKYNQQEDLIYFVLNAVKQLKLAENKVTVHLSGKIIPSTFDEFRNFFANVKLEKVNGLQLSDDKLFSIPRHEYALILV